MEEYPRNSRNTPKEPAQEDRPELTKVIQGTATQRKKPLGKRFRETFFGTEDAAGILGYVVRDVAVPALKDLLFDMGSKAAQRALFGTVDDRVSHSRVSTRPGQYIAYNRVAAPTIHDRRPSARRDDRLTTPPREFQEIILESRHDAQEVLSRLYELLDRFGTATVSDLYDLTGVPSTYIDKQWGWTSLHGTQITRLNTGYLLDVPTPDRLD